MLIGIVLALAGCAPIAFAVYLIQEVQLSTPDHYIFDNGIMVYMDGLGEMKWNTLLAILIFGGLALVSVGLFVFCRSLKR